MYFILAEHLKTWSKSFLSLGSFLCLQVLWTWAKFFVVVLYHLTCMLVPHSHSHITAVLTVHIPTRPPLHHHMINTRGRSSPSSENDYVTLQPVQCTLTPPSPPSSRGRSPSPSKHIPRQFVQYCLSVCLGERELHCGLVCLMKNLKNVNIVGFNRED